MEWLLGVWRVHRQHTDGAWTGAQRGNGVVVRCTEGRMEWLIGAWRVCKGGYGMVARCMEGAIEWLLGAWRAHEGYTKGAQRTCKGCGRGMEWLLGVQRGNRVVTRCRQGMQRVHEGTWRACGEHSPSVHLATIPYPPHILHVPSAHPPCT